MDEAGARAAADPLRAHFVQALARRAATRQGSELALLQARLAALQAQPQPAAVAAAAAGAPRRPAPGPGPLAALLQGLRPPAPVAGPRAAGGAAAEPDMLQFFRSTWARLDAERRLNASLAEAPDNPGPLNSEHLVHQALQLMRSAAPDYLRHFMAQVDALVWLEDALADSAAAAKPVPKPKAAKAANTSKAGKTPPKDAKGGRKTKRA
jgi:hypothetical protein